MFFLQNWGNNGQVYADYAELKTLGRTPRRAGDDEMDHEDEFDDDRTEALINSIEARLKAPVFDNPLQRFVFYCLSIPLIFQ